MKLVPFRIFPRLSVCARVVSALLLVAASAATAGAQTLNFKSNLADAMVLQRNTDVPIAGVGRPGVAVTVTLGQQSKNTRANADGEWEVKMRTSGARTPQTLVATDALSGRAVIENIAFGEVWLCSGQSNMAFTVAEADRSQEAYAAARRADIRVMKVAKKRTAASQPLQHLDLETPWSRANRETLSDFSAVCWAMGLDLHRALGVPVGLIDSSVDDTSIENWISADALTAVGGLDEAVALNALHASDPRRGLEAYRAQLKAWLAKHDPGTKAFLSNSAMDWRPLPRGQRLTAWTKAQGVKLRGVTWLRHEFDLSPAQAAQNLALLTGTLQPTDTLWINGSELPRAASLDGNTSRTPIAQSTLRKGTNTLVVRLATSRWESSFGDKAPALRMADGRAMPLEGFWLFNTTHPYGNWSADFPEVPWLGRRGASPLYNAMIAPLAPMQLAGVALYQGEANASLGQSQRYYHLLNAWRADWRRTFDNPRLPFLIYQLTGFGEMKSKPMPSTWAAIRKAQSDAAAADAQTGLGVTIDLGVPYDIHPVHKIRVGKRGAAQILRVAYGRETPPPPAPVTAQRADGTIVITFNTSALKAVGAGSAIGFERCGSADQCVFTQGHVDGNTVSLPVGDKEVLRVRHAWADYPLVNVFAASGLPLSSFDIPVAP